MTETKIKVHLVEDHAIVRAGLVALLDTAEDIQVVGESADGRSAVEAIMASKPDVVVCDLALPGLSGLDVIRRVVSQSPPPKIVVLSMYHDHVWIQRAVESGASGYVLKGSGVQDVVQAIRTVFAGEQFLTPRALLQSQVDPLSQREREVLTLIAEGHTSREIGDILEISSRTAEHHRARIMKKLGINDLAGLVRYAIRNGLVDENLN